VPESFPNAVPVYEALGAGRGRCANTTAPPRCSPFNDAARATLQACGREVAWNRGAGPARIWGCGMRRAYRGFRCGFRRLSGVRVCKRRRTNAASAARRTAQTVAERHRVVAKNRGLNGLCGGSTGLLWSSARTAAGELVSRRLSARSAKSSFHRPSDWCRTSADARGFGRPCSTGRGQCTECRTGVRSPDRSASAGVRQSYCSAVWTTNLVPDPSSAPPRARPSQGEEPRALSLTASHNGPRMLHLRA
jgi:hypothetical protein